MTRERGTVKWFSTEKGYGFIRRQSGEEIFVHHSDIEVDGYASLRNGEAVEFEVFESDRGPKARKLVPLQPAEGTAESAAARSSSASVGRGEGSRRRRTRGEPGVRDAGKTLAEQLGARLERRFPALGR